MSRCIDLTGQKFGKLTVIKRVENYVSPKGTNYAQWLCECECGNKAVVYGSYLRNGHTKSCGCLIGKIASKNKKKYNTYDLSGEYGVGYTSKDEEFYFDLEDYSKIKDYCWSINKLGYVTTNVWDFEIKKANIFSMHRLIMKCNDSKLDIDHINHIKNDNRKSNLRIVTRSQNNMNKELMSNNTSGITGVYLNKMTNKWVAQITINKKLKNLGVFDEFKDAVRARKEAEEKYYGEYSYDNSIKIKERLNERN